MNIQEQIAKHKQENEEAAAKYARRMVKDSTSYCVKNGGHFMSPWNAVVFNPIFHVASLEEAVCSACGYTETRVPMYNKLKVKPKNLIPSPHCDSDYDADDDEEDRRYTLDIVGE